VLAAVAAMIGVNAASHLVTAGLLPVNVPLVVAVSAIAPLVLWRVHRLADEPEAPAEPNLVDVARDVPVPTVERVPDVYPVLETAVPAVPEAVPAGVRLLPIIARPEPVETVGVAASEPSRTRPEVHGEYVPEPVPDWTVSGTYADEDGNPTEPDPTDDGYGDPLSEYGLGLAAEAFKEQLLDGYVPSIRAIKAQLSVGQPRAKEIQDGFRQVLLRQGATS
jgi:hypothetical protein